ncbi:hypothetical protein ACFQS7_14665 [Dankookia sp. GCM10030260]|uniref:hypothetical protein n=1 Tax=Dankookia sp. GCM10030260 TaxID=3273390 RepID=UPI0036177141
MEWSATFTSGRIGQERDTLTRARDELERELERQIEAVRALYAEKINALDAELADLDRFERVAVRLASSSHPASNEDNKPPSHPSSSQSFPQRSLLSEPELPSQKTMVLEAVAANPAGLPRPEIVSYIKTKFGFDISPGNVTTSLYRLKTEDGLVRNAGRLWFPISHHDQKSEAEHLSSAEKGEATNAEWGVNHPRRNR